MSGGSYNYLCHSYDLHDILDKRHDLERMADRLERLGWANDAAKETRHLIADINAAQVRAEVALDRLRDVWKAVEWWDSADSNEDGLRSALDRYRGTPEEEELTIVYPFDANLDIVCPRDAVAGGWTKWSADSFLDDREGPVWKVTYSGKKP